MVRCGNQFTVRNQQFRVQHTTNSSERIEQLLRGFELYAKQDRLIFEDFKTFSEVEISKELIDTCIRRVINMEDEETSVRKANIYKEIASSVYKECFEVGNNLFGLFNGFTHYTTHVRKAPEKPFGNVSGAVADINTAAYNWCKNQTDRNLSLPETADERFLHIA
jgi:hypothetical protein